MTFLRLDDEQYKQAGLVAALKDLIDYVQEISGPSPVIARAIQAIQAVHASREERDEQQRRRGAW